jgi:predicted ATPase/class 3 adenylate cyclase/DNA-binding CsgD family transcriptional regulator
MPNAAPEGIVTFLLTDVVGSTRLWQDSPDAAAKAVARHRTLIEAAVERHGGVRPPDQGEGDSTLSVFNRPGDALAAALSAQQTLAAEVWPEGAAIEVRMALATGETTRLEGGNYGGVALIRGARVRSLAHGRQVLLAGTTAELVAEHLPEGASLAEVGEATLPGFDRPERIAQLRHPDLPIPEVHLGLLRATAQRGITPWPTSLVGRERERAEVAKLLESARLVTITGVGGAGKTRLAHAVAEDLGERFADGVVWVELERVSDDRQVPSAVLAASGTQEAPGLPVQDQLVARLSDTELLLVLDNCEHVLDAAVALVEAVLRGALGVRILVTAREPLAVEGEFTWRIPSLTLPVDDAHELAAIEACDAVRLFAERARAARSDFVLDQETSPVVARICRRLDGIPLALELAAARLRMLSLERLAGGLADRFRLLTGGARTSMARQRTLLASVEWSHDLLEDAEKTLFRRLSVFAAPFTLEAAEGVAADEELPAFEVFDLLTNLVDKSLVLHTGDRYRLLETLRQYAQDRAHDAGELETLRERHQRWFAGRVRGWNLRENTARGSQLDLVEEERADLIAALHWSQAPGAGPDVDLLYTLAAYWFLRFGGEELRASAAQLLRGLEPGSPAWLETLAPLTPGLFFAGEIAWLGPATEGLERHRDALDANVQSRLEASIGMPGATHGRPEGIARWQRARELAREVCRDRELDTTVGLSIMLTQEGRLKEARPLIEWIRRSQSDDSGLAFGLGLGDGWTALFSGDFARARERLTEIIHMREGGASGGEGWLGWVALCTEDRALAAESLATLERARFLGAFQGFLALARAVVHVLGGDEATAREALRAADSDPLIGTTAFWPRVGLVELEIAAGNVTGARARCDELEERLEGCVMPIFQGWLHDLAARLAREDGDLPAAERRAHDGLETSTEHGLDVQRTDLLETLAVLAADAGRKEGAGRLLGATEAFRARTGYSFRWSHRARSIEAMRGALDPAHLEEGAKLTLEEAADYVRRGRGERGRPGSGWESLTPTEERVVALVAEGLTNKAVAAKLFVSVATVKTHLVHVFTKLDVKNRAELTRKAVAR